MNYLYSCEKCSFFSNKITNYNLHFKTKKHNNINELNYECKKCNKKYKYNSGLSKHKKICKQPENIVITNQELSNEVITQFKDELKEQTQQHQKEIKEQNQQYHKDLEELKQLIIGLTKK